MLALNAESVSVSKTETSELSWYFAVEEETFFGLTVTDWQETKKNAANPSVLMNRITEVVMLLKSWYLLVTLILALD